MIIASKLGQLPSSRLFEVRLEGRSMPKHRPENIDPSSREGEERLVMALPLLSLPVVEGTAIGVVEGTKGRLVEDALEGFVAAEGPSQKPEFAGLAQHRGNSGCGG